MSLVGRKEEQELLNRAVSKQESQFIAVNGRHRVGKTYLIQEMFSNQFSFVHTGDFNLMKKKAEENHTTVSDAELNKWAALRWIDLIFFAAIIFVVIYTVTNFGRLRDFDKVVSPVQTIDYVAMVCIIVLLLEAVRRTLGNILFFFIIAFIVYSWTAQYFPKGTVLYTKGKSFAKMLKTFCAGMILGESGVYGTPLTTSCTSLFYFIVFGAFFSECGGGQLLIDVGLKFSNKSSGGPAKAAVISSGLMGMVSGSAVANVATTGVMTIPMMKKIGY